jgi:hypothetical protein
MSLTANIKFTELWRIHKLKAKYKLKDFSIKCFDVETQYREFKSFVCKLKLTTHKVLSNFMKYLTNHQKNNFKLKVETLQSVCKS